MSRERRTILAVNTGSSSLKLGVFDWETLEERAERDTDWGTDDAAGVKGHGPAVRHLLDGLDVSSVAVVGHRVVHGGAEFRQAVRIDGAVKAGIERLAALAPLHNPAALEAIEAVDQALPGVPQTASFDTAFHATMPPSSYLYAVPYEWYERWGARRYGFHGLSHAYCSARAAELLGRPLADLKVVTCHLGSGCSLAAVRGGLSVATTMGFTPLDGIAMATRSGAVDPGLLLYALTQQGMTPADLDDALNHRSGLLGVSGSSADMREILAARERGDERATLAFDLFCARVRDGIAAMAAAMGGLDAVAWAGGIGEHAAAVRGAVCASLDWLGMKLDAQANEHAAPDADVAAATSPVRILVIHTREELVVAREARKLV